MLWTNDQHRIVSSLVLIQKKHITCCPCLEIPDRTQQFPHATLFLLATRAPRATLAALVADQPVQVLFQPFGVGGTDCELSHGVTDFLWDNSFAYSESSARNVAVYKLDSLCVQGLIPRPSFVKMSNLQQIAAWTSSVKLLQDLLTQGPFMPHVLCPT